MEHFHEALYRPEPEDLADLQPVTNVLDIDTRPPTESEVKNAIKDMKSGKVPGIDSIHTEMLKLFPWVALERRVFLCLLFWSRETRTPKLAKLAFIEQETVRKQHTSITL